MAGFPLRAARLVAFVVFTILLASTTAAWLAAPVDAQEAGRSTIPVDSLWPGARPWQVDISDDGRYVAYQARGSEGFQLHVYDRSTGGTRVVEGLGDMPYFGHFSPDNSWILFGKKMQIWKVPSEGGEVSLVYGGNNFKVWENNNSIIISRGANGFWRVSADGSLTREQIAEVDTSTGATNYGRPSMLPGGKGLLTSVGFDTGVALRELGIISLPDGNLTHIPEKGLNPRYAESGHILYAQGDALKALPFDIDRMEVSGDPVTVVDGMHTYSNRAAQFDISRDGVLIYVPGRSDVGRTWPRKIVWVSRDGREEPFHTANKSFHAVRVSPDRQYVAAEVGQDLMLFNTVTDTWAMVSEGGFSSSVVWAPDSKSLYFNKGGALLKHEIDGSGEPIELVPEDGLFWADSLSDDGSQLVGTRATRSADDRIFQLRTLSTVPVGGADAPQPILGQDAPPTRRSAVVSPDGRWVAYVNKKEHLDGVYVQPYPDGGTPLLVSEGAVGEASEPLWGGSSNELFYVDAMNMVAVKLATEPDLHVADRTALFEISRYYRLLNTWSATYDYDAATDRFLMPKWVIPDPPGTDIMVIENAFEMLERIAPAQR